MGKDNEIRLISQIGLWLFFLVFFAYPIALLFSKVLSADALARSFSALSLSKTLLWNSASQAFASTVLSFLMGFPLAFIMAKRDFPGRKIFRAVSLVPFVFPSILVVLSFVIVFGNNGWLNRSLDFFGLPQLNFLYGFWGIVLGHSFYNFPIVMRFVSDALESSGSQMEEAARSLGAAKFQTFFRVTLPQLSPSILASCSLVFIYCFTSFAIVLAFGGIQFTNFEAEIYMHASRGLDLGLGAGLALFQLALLALPALSYLYFSARLSIGQPGFFVKRGKLKLNSFRGAAEAALLLLAIAFVLIPIASILAFALDLDSGSLSLRAFAKIFTTAPGILGTSPLNSIFYSLAIALAASVISTAFGCIASIYSKGFSAVTAFLASSMAVSVVTLGFGYYIGFGSGGIMIIAFGHAVLAFPFAFRLISGAVSSIQAETIDAAASMGANHFQMLRLVYFPRIKNALFASLAFSFAVSLGELGLALVLYDGVYATMPIYIYRLISTFDIRAAAAMGAVLFLLSFFCFYLIEHFSGRRQVAL